MNYKKLFQVILVIAILSAISLLVTIGGLRMAKRMDQRKRMKRSQSQVARQQRSSSSSTQTTVNNLSIASSRQQQQKRNIVLPPSVIPPFNPKLPLIQSKKSAAQPSALNQLISQTTGSQFTGFGQVNLRNPNETNLLLMQEMNFQNEGNEAGNNAPTASFNLND